MSEIQFEHVSRAYAQTVAVDAVDYTVVKGSTTALIGPSGSGKSTLLQMINGLVKPDSGTVEIFGEPIDYDNLPQLRLKIGYAVQGTGLFPHMSCANNVTLLARLNGWDKKRIDDRLEELLSLVELERSVAERYPHELSGGQQQRLGLCRAMMLNPPVLILDESFAALDPITKNEIHGHFLRLQAAEPRTIILVTHDLREALKLGDQLVILNRGRIEQSGGCEDVVGAPANEFVRRFLESQSQP